MGYPSTIPSFSTHVFGETISADHMNAVQAEIVALATKLGVGVVTDAQTAPSNTIDYLVRAALNPGHTHSDASVTSLAETKITGSTVMARKNSNETISFTWTFSTSQSFTGGYGANPATASSLRIGAGGGNPNAVSMAFGDNTGWKFHIGTSVASTFTPRFTVLDTGNVGIGTTTPNAALQFANTTVNRKIVLYESINNDHQYYGFGVNAGSILRYQMSSNASSAAHLFCAGVTGSSSNELMKIYGPGGITVGHGLTTLPTSTTSLHMSRFISDSANVYKLSVEHYQDANDPTTVELKKSKGSYLSPGSLTSLLQYGVIRFTAYGNSGFVTPAAVAAKLTGSWPSSDTQGAQLQFCTSSNADTTVPLARMTITEVGDVLVGYSSVRGTYGTDSRVLSIAGGPFTGATDSYAVVELYNGIATDSASNIQGEYAFVDPNNSTKRIAAIRCQNIGSTAGNRGAQLEFYVKRDGGAVMTAAVMNSTSDGGQLSIGTGAAPGATLHIGGSVAIRYRTVTVSTQLDSASNDYVVACNQSSVTITMPAVAPTVGRVFIIKNTSNGNLLLSPGTGFVLEARGTSVSGTNTIILPTLCSETLVYVGLNIWRSISWN